MLILSRRRGEVINIGNNIEVIVLEITPDGRCRLGIVAPKDVEVHRHEVYKRIWDSKPKDQT